MNRPPILRRAEIVPHVEIALLSILGLGFLCVLQTWSFGLYRVGLVVVIIATLLNIAVGNLPRDASWLRAGLLTLSILATIALVFAIGVALVPALATLGQDAS